MGTHQTEPEEGLTRSQVAERLGISPSSVRRLEGIQLQPVQDRNGIWRFDPAELENITARSDRARVHRPVEDGERAVARRGRMAARVFCMFARNLTLPQIVVATRQPPAVVRALYHEWMTSLDEEEWNRRTM